MNAVSIREPPWAALHDDPCHRDRTSSGLTVLSPTDPQWRTFASKRATSPLQLPTWLEVLTQAYGFRARVVVLVDGRGAALAGMPMIHGKLPLRQRWTSLPFTDTFEPLAVDSRYRDELLSTIARDGDPVLLRSHVSLTGWSSRQVGTVQFIDLTDGAEGVLRNAHAKTRREVKRAQRPEAGLTARPIASREEFLGANLALTAQSRRRLGVPTQPRRYWSRVWALHERGEAFTIGVYLSSALVASGTFILGSGHAVYKYSASDPSSWKLRANYLMLASAFDHAAERGARSMDFGVTDLNNTSLRDFKSRWGGDQRPAHFSATRADLLPDSLEPGRLLTAAVRHMPVSFGRTVGSLAYPFAA